MTSSLVLPGGYRYSSGGQQRSGGGGGGGGRRNYKPVDLDFESEDRQDTMGFKPDDFNTLLSYGYKPGDDFGEMRDFVEQYNNGFPNYR